MRGGERERERKRERRKRERKRERKKEREGEREKSDSILFFNVTIHNRSNIQQFAIDW